MQSNITLVTIMASCAGFLLFFFVVAFLHFHEYLDYHCLRDRDFFSSKTLITILPSLHYQLHYHIALGLAIPTFFPMYIIIGRFRTKDLFSKHGLGMRAYGSGQLLYFQHFRRYSVILAKRSSYGKDCFDKKIKTFYPAPGSAM